MKILVAGATGYLGHFVVRELGRRGHEVRALARKPEKLALVREWVSEVFEGEATDPTTLAGLCEGCDAVFSSLGIRAFSGTITYEHVDYGANMNVLERAVEAGVGRFGFVSVLHGEAHREVPQVDARERVVDALKASPLPWTVIRPTGFFNDMAEFFEMARKGGVWIVGDGENRINPVAGGDLAAYVADKLVDPAAALCEFAVGGPEILTMRQIAQIALEAAGSKGTVHSLPPWVLGALGVMSAPFSPNFSNMMKFFGALSESDGVGEQTGALTLRTFYDHLAAGGTPDDLDIGVRA